MREVAPAAAASVISGSSVVQTSRSLTLRVLKPRRSARRAHSTSALPSVQGACPGMPMPMST